ncbi:MAG: HK97 gp10 family phage protein [Microbacterium sp.]|jgi:hypothetical protein|nr:HK97 gp10 family phage protein [Microbacterium sp.]
MARNGDTRIEWDENFFQTAMRDPRVERLQDNAGETVQAKARASAPVDSGDYRDGIVIEHVDAEYRRVTRVVGTDEKTLLIEAKTGNLARALKAAKK